ncbi:hypothetical protein GCM10009528_29280 [Kineococcus aurantiacus]
MVLLSDWEHAWMLVARPPSARALPRIGTTPGARPGPGTEHDAPMDERDIHQQIDELVATEHRLRQALQAGELTAEEEHAQLRAAEEALDQAWDLLRQREARRNAGQDPDSASVRPVSEVEHYQQ